MPQENERGDPPRFLVEVLEVRIPGEGHKDVRQGEQNHRLPQHRNVLAKQGHSLTIPWLATAGSQAATVPRPGMTSSRCDFGQRLEDEGAQVQARMRQGQARQV